jgi:hypothetical protein
MVVPFDWYMHVANFFFQEICFKLFRNIMT